MSDVKKVRVLVWDENPQHADPVLYPHGIREAVAGGLRELAHNELEISTAHLDDPDQGVPEAVLAVTDVLIWWGHARHEEVSQTTVGRVLHRVCEEGMGFIALHSAHYSKTFRQLLGCNGHLKGGWRVTSPPEREEIRVCAPWHPIAAGVTDFVLPCEEMYGAPFDVPPPLVQVFQSHFPLDGKTFPSGLCWTVGRGIDRSFASGPGEGVGEGFGVGRVFYFRPGHETVDSYHDATVRRVLVNAVKWCAKLT